MKSAAENNDFRKKFLTKMSLKLNMCSSVKKSDDYAFVPYEPIQTQGQLLLPKPELKKQEAMSDLNNENYNKIKQPQFHSTQMEASSFDDTNYSRLFNLTDTFIPNKITSTILQKSSILSVDLEHGLSKINEETFENQSHGSSSDYSSQYSYSYDSETTESDTLNDSEYWDVYVCCQSYEARFKGDLSLKLMDHLVLIHDNDDFALVKNISSGRCGYVPRKHIKKK